jgi:beta-glucosidase
MLSHHPGPEFPRRSRFRFSAAVPTPDHPIPHAWVQGRDCLQGARKRSQNPAQKNESSQAEPGLSSGRFVARRKTGTRLRQSRFYFLKNLLFPALALLSLSVTAAPSATLPDQDKTAAVETRVADLLARLTTDEKISLLGGENAFYIRAIPRLGLPAIRMADGPLGVRNYGPSTAYPATVALAASWDTALARDFGEALGRDSRARGVHILLAPAIDIQRVPQNGRNFEYLSEDPDLAAAIAVPIVTGIQSQGVVATVKHFAVNNQETDRMTVDARVDPRTLHEIYLPAFRAAVQEGHAWAIMDAYNRLNGIYCTASDWLNNRVLKEAWHFPGVVMSDWGATHDTLGAATGGLDLEMPSGQFFNAQKLQPLLDAGRITPAVLDDKVRRILRLEIANGFLDRPNADDTIPKDDPRSAGVALQIAREGLVLLKNAGNLLPLDRARLKSVVVLGPMADVFPQGGGSSRVTPFHSTSVLAGLRAALGDTVRVDFLPKAGASHFSQLLDTASYVGPLKLEFFRGRALRGRPVATREESRLDHDWSGHSPAPGVPPEDFSARWTGLIRAPATDDYVFMLASDDGARVFIDDAPFPLIDLWGDHAEKAQRATLSFKAGSTHRLRVEYYQHEGGAAVRFAWGLASPPPLLTREFSERIQSADAVIVCAGYSAREETEGADRSFVLPGDQPALIRAVAELNPHTIVVLNSGGAVATSGWLDRVPALLDAAFPGQEGGQAVAEALLGDFNPGGKLPYTFAERLEDYPSFGRYPGHDGHVDYTEGLFVGYRWFDQQGLAPLFPFGFGLSYTSFEYKNLHGAPAPDGGYVVSFDLTNTGPRAGAEVAQVYVAPSALEIPQAVRALKGFSRVSLKPGETRLVSIALPRRAFAHFDERTRAWIVAPGNFTLSIGASSRDLPLSATVAIE